MPETKEPVVCFEDAKTPMDGEYAYAVVQRLGAIVMPFWTSCALSLPVFSRVARGDATPH
ncbi:MAG: hypothetical protein HY644_13715 [Acidobacteria bacterium]|nr:hypothetical protein [Acidobacteriota bacterium]